ncbi:tryptophan 2,3-dioxygenase family protein [Streptomyces virginiae]|uniref:tryptophan 2,3-dioxygenase family protein n=1 Tax=Streptomyces virginiae TaxID=1961 RepID=UPI0036770F12
MNVSTGTTVSGEQPVALDDATRLRSTPYSEYLSLPQVLSAQHPRGLDGSHHARSAEHLFIVAHQSSEMWIKQVLLDCSTVAAELKSERGRLHEVRDLLIRISDVINLLVANMSILSRLSAQHFAQFRPRLGEASGAQSDQLRRLFSYLGLPRGRSTLMLAFLDTLDRRNLTLSEIFLRGAEGGVLFDIAEAFTGVAESMWAWQVAHVQVTHRMLGRSPGTGGSDGVDYLMRRAAFPFPEIWEAKASLHRS